MTKPSASMREPTYFILAALQDEPLHGYAIVKRAQDLSGGRVRLTTGTLYAALDRLTGEEMVRVAEEAVVNGRARRTYELTERGLSALREEAARMAAAARVVRDRSVRSTAATVRTVPA
ncbi:PadR family transcriptional regulator [Micromonospora sp. CPCC 205539]|uniref:PadR family transcriptional regulator n=1 Tax=Micromonospora sp. CPCC 205539 TaxID=3122408 RepID=UPI002FF1C37F